VPAARRCGSLTRESEAAEQLPQRVVDGAPRKVLLVHVRVHGGEAQPVRAAQELAHLTPSKYRSLFSVFAFL